MSLLKPVYNRRNPRKPKKKGPKKPGFMLVEPSVSLTNHTGKGARARNKVTQIPNFRSGFERKFWDHNAGKIKDLEYESLRIKASYLLEFTYLPDFIQRNYDGTITVWETKGRWMPKDRRRLLAVLECNPGLTVVMCFMRDQPINKNSKTLYSDWCRKHGVSFCIGVDLTKTVHLNRVRP